MGGGGTGANTKYGATVDTFLGDVDSTGKLLKPTAQTDLVFDGVTDLVDDALEYRLYKLPTIKTVSFPNLVQISGNSAMYNCFYRSSIESISFPVLQSVTGSFSLYRTFEYTSIQSASFPALTNIRSGAFQYIFNNCNKLTSCSFPAVEELPEGFVFSKVFCDCRSLVNVQFPKLKKIGSNTTSNRNYGHFSRAFENCSKLTSIEFPELTAIYCTDNTSIDQTFYGNNRIQKLYFPKLSVIDKSPAYTGVSVSVAHKSIFYGCSSLTEIHFGAANQAAIEATEGYPTLWGLGKGKATVYFDL